MRLRHQLRPNPIRDETNLFETSHMWPEESREGESGQGVGGRQKTLGFPIRSLLGHNLIILWKTNIFNSLHINAPLQVQGSQFAFKLQ